MSTLNAVTAPSDQKPQGRTLLFAIITITVWSSAFPAIRVGLTAFNPFHVALLRYLTASAVLAVYAVITRMPLPRRADLPALALSGLVGFTIYNALLNWGEMIVPSAVASFIIASAPVFIALFATIFLHERLRVFGWLGIGISFIGVTVIAFSSGTGFQLEPHALIIVVAALAQTFYTVRQKPLLKRYTPVQFTAYSIWFGTLFLLVFAPGLPQEIQNAPLNTLVAVVYLGIFPGAIGYITWSVVLSRMPASIAASLLYVVPAIALIIAWLWLGELPLPVAIAGGVLVVIGVITVNTLGRQRNAAVVLTTPVPSIADIQR
jgi:drug/metabolite transporter (DMT)-like permease